MKILLSTVLALLILSWLSPWFDSPYRDNYGRYGFLMDRQMSYRKVNIPRLVLTDLMIVAAGGIAVVLGRKS
ncbi:MAG: hypothetical protein WBD81_17835 [Collimonas pratensis]|uniref:hypothetical protein n=1 Tax=Collimonas pratensis TaxID=279113 RepID=UPI003C772591